MKIIIDNEVHQKIMCWVNASKFEVSGFGNVVIEDKETLRVVSAHLCKQMNSAAETDIKAEDVAKALYETRNDPGEMRFWWHSHVQMGCFWSGTDHQAMRDFASTPDSWIICTVFNQKNEHRSAYFAPQGSKMPWGNSSLLYDQVDTQFPAYVNPKVAEWEAEYKAKVSNERPYSSRWNAMTGQGSLTNPLKLTKKERKRLKKAEKEKAGTTTTVVEKLAGETTDVDADANGNIKDAYGFTVDDWQLFAESGWTVKDIDDLIDRDFTQRQIIMICTADFLPGEVQDMLDKEELTTYAVMRKVVEQHDFTADDDAPADDVPVADRGRSVIDMRNGNYLDYNDLNDHEYSGRGNYGY